MSMLEIAAPEAVTPVLGAITSLMAVPASLLVAVAAFFGIRRTKVDSYVVESLDRFLAEEAKAFRQRVGQRLLDFRTSESVSATPAGLGLGRVQIHRTILAQVRDGYRVRIRAFAEGARGRVIVRHCDVELRRKR